MTIMTILSKLFFSGIPISMFVLGLSTLDFIKWGNIIFNIGIVLFIITFGFGLALVWLA